MHHDPESCSSVYVSILKSCQSWLPIEDIQIGGI